ncbi:Saccharopine dehydrogenase [Trypanosoma melophagium]|uniref:Saccharopine dehydrogenase n=1 Tax=Trypanosoma melophagium TaxID=715481 RepID=UPI00351A1C7B|nr:Saccharopine dehydrogenase [Trypanosoma melophagium]
MSRKFALVVLGATGYTGKLVCQYISKLDASTIGPWGIAGRSEEKLNVLKKELGVDISVLAADLANPSSLDKICSSTNVLISCAGPFTLVGMPVVESCVRCKTHYIDSTGEFNFVRQVAERFHEEAKKQGITLVSCCGFDSVPADIGNYVVHQAKGLEIKDVRAFYNLSSSGISGGTAHSIMAFYEACTPEDMDPYSLVPKDASRPAEAPSQRGMWYDSLEKKFTAPFLMSATNERVVRRTNALLGYNSTYMEAMEGTIVSVVGTTLSSFLMKAIGAIPFFRRYAAAHWIPTPGSGPTEEKKASAWYKCAFVGIDTAGNRRRRVHLSDSRDMYTATGLYIVESALSLLQKAKDGTLKSGVLTPMAAFGEILLERVQKAGINVQVVDETNETTTSTKN